MSLSDRHLAITLAKEAGDILLHHWHRRNSLQVHTKRAGDFVSQADHAAEAHLRARLAVERPGDGWLGEETGSMAALAQRRWIIDPLDGTTNFLRGIGHWSVSIALEIDTVMSVGVIYDPLRDECFVAVRGGGAYLNSSPIRAAPTPDLASALLGTGIPFGGMGCIDAHAADIARLMPLCAGVRRMGSAALDLAYVAAGRLDAFWERRLQLWDIAAGLVLLRESGALVEGWERGERPEQTGSVITATPALFASFAAQLRGR